MPKSSVLETQGVTEYGTVGTTKGDGVVSIDLADDGTIIDGLGTVIDGLGTATVDVTLVDVTLADGLGTVIDGLGTVIDGLGTATADVTLADVTLADVTLADVTLADVTLADGLGTVLFIFNKT